MPEAVNPQFSTKAAFASHDGLSGRGNPRLVRNLRRPEFAAPFSMETMCSYLVGTVTRFGDMSGNDSP